VKIIVIKLKINRKIATPIYQQLCDSLTKAIRSGMTENGGRLPSENAISSRISVNRLTVRKALSTLAAKGLIESVPGKGWYVRQGIDLAGSGGKISVGIYGVGLNNMHNSIFYCGFMNHLIESAGERGIALKLLPFQGKGAIPNLSEATNCKHIIWMLPQEQDAVYIHQLQKNGIQVTSAFRELEDHSIPFVDIDQYAGAYELACRLTDAGHRRVGMITIDTPLDYALKREHACRDALLEVGSMLPEEFVLRIDPQTDWSKEAAEFLRKDMTAVFIAGNSLHWIFFNVIMKMKLKIPDDLSVAAFDEVRHPSFSDCITCIRQPLEKAADCLLDIACEAAGSISIDPEVVAGASVKQLVKKKKQAKEAVLVN
jgi:DNA-binding LacI/PurR family transcriptional regulator